MDAGNLRKVRLNPELIQLSAMIAPTHGLIFTQVATGCSAKVWLWDRTAPRDAGCPLGRCRTQGQIEGLHKPPAIDGCSSRAHAILRAEHVALAGRLDLAL